jgi:hypothetical protein
MSTRGNPNAEPGVFASTMTDDIQIPYIVRVDVRCHEAVAVSAAHPIDPNAGTMARDGIIWVAPVRTILMVLKLICRSVRIPG